MPKFLETFRNKKVLNGIRVKPNPGKSREAEFDPDDELASILAADDSNKQQILSIQQFRELSQNRNEQYQAFDEMEKDATVSAALKMYADDATQYNLDGNVLWVESDDPDIAKFGNRLIEVLRLNQNAWTHIYNLVKYGDIYLETFYDDEENDGMIAKNIHSGYGTNVMSHRAGARIEEYVEMVPNSASIFDLRRKGKVSGFIKLQDEDPNKTNYSRAFSTSIAGTDQKILPSDKYVHIMLGEASDRYPETFEIEYQDESGETVTTSFKVAKGKSMLSDAFKSFRELKLMEDSILLNRVTRSSITRILQVEVGDMPKTQVREKLRQIKNMIEQRNFLDKNNGELNNMTSPGPVDNVIYVPTRQGNGAITSTTLGGDVDPKSLADIEYYKQKLAGGLGIPLSYLQGQSGDGGGLSSGTALTKLDNRYARAVKRIQIAYTSGIQTLLNIFAIRKGLDEYVNNFTVKMLSPSTIEDADRDEQLDNRVRMTNDIISLVSSQDSVYSAETVKEVTEYLISTFLNKPEISDILKNSENSNDDSETSDSEDTLSELDNGEESFSSDDFSEPEVVNQPDEFTDIDNALNVAEPLEPTEPESDDTGFGNFEEYV